MRHWALVPPLANFSRGLLKHPYHPLHGSGCSAVTLWGYLNEVFLSTEKTRRGVLANQYTNSVVFDNYQLMIQKKWQTYGCSGNYLKGVASLTKKDKAILLPVGSVIRSPSGVLFEVRSCHYVNEYLTVVDGVMVVGDGEVSTSSADINADVGHELRVSDGDVSTSSTDINADAGPGVSDISYILTEIFKYMLWVIADYWDRSLY